MSFFEPISGADFDKKLEAARATAGARIIDVRSAVEFAEGHVPGVENIPLNQIPTLDAPKDTPFSSIAAAAPAAPGAARPWKSWALPARPIWAAFWTTRDRWKPEPALSGKIDKRPCFRVY